MTSIPHNFRRRFIGVRQTRRSVVVEFDTYRTDSDAPVARETFSFVLRPDRISIARPEEEAEEESTLP